MKPAPYRKFNGVQYILDDLSYKIVKGGLTESDAKKRKAMWKSHGYKVRLVKNENGRYLVYREYPI